MPIDLNDILVPTRGGKYAMRLFNTVNLELARDVMEAIGELNFPVIIGTAKVLLPYRSIEDLADLLVLMAKRASVPVMVHLDRGLKEETCRQAPDLGFSSIMYDCSAMEYEANIEHVKKITETTHTCGASIKAELGHVGDNGGEDSSLFHTDSVQIQDFIERTGADALVVTVGTAHGAYKLPPRLDFNRITEIAENIPTPLVLHGGSGLSDSDFRTAVEWGINRVNIFTDTNQVCARVAALGYREEIGLTDIVLLEIEAMRQFVMEKMRLFRSVG